jgi:hypothetical protein
MKSPYPSVSENLPAVSPRTIKGRKILVLAVVVAFFGSFTTVLGQTYTWNVSGDGSWVTSTNWDPERTTPATTDILVFDNGYTMVISDVPTQTIGKLQISNNTNVTLKPPSTSSDTLIISTAANDALTVESGSTLTITGRDSGTDRSLTVATANSTGLQAHIYGTLKVGLDNNQVTAFGLFTRAGANATTYFHSGSTYEHAVSGGTVPGAVWDVSSTCLITGIRSTVPVIPAAANPFGNFTWNCASQGAIISLSSQLTSVNGNMTVNSTGSPTSYPLLLGTTGTADLTVGGNFVQTGGTFGIVGGTGNRKMTVNGNCSLNGGTFYMSPYAGNSTLEVLGTLTSAATLNFAYWVSNTAVINAKGNCLITGGTVTMSSTAGVGTLNVSGDFSHTGGTITESSTGSGSIVFNGASPQTYTSGGTGTISGTINFTVNSGSFLQMASEGTVVTGDGTFTVQSGATLGIRSGYGITVSGSGATGGNIQTLSRVYSSGAKYVYNGTAAQVTGDGLTQNTPADVTINNSAGVTLSAATTTSGLLTMTNGTLDLGGYNLTVGSLTGTSHISLGTATLTVGSDGTGPAAYSGVISGTGELTMTGTGTLTLSGTNTYSGDTRLNGGTLRLASATAIDNNSDVVFNGGTFSSGSGAGYSETVGTMDLQANSTIALGSGSHTLTFAASDGVSWGGGAILSITGWTGTSGSSGTSGKIFVGSDDSGLTSSPAGGQLAQISFYGFGTGATMLSTGEVVPLNEPSVMIASPAVAAGDIVQNTADNVIYILSNTVSNADAIITGLQITTETGYSAADLTNLKAWYSSDGSFSSSSDDLLSTKTASLGPGTHVFPSWTDQILPVGVSYIFITADIPCSAAAGSAITVDAVATSDITLMTGTKSGSTSAGGTQTIVAADPVDVSSPGASVEDSKSILSWTGEGCYDMIMIVAKAGGYTSGTPTGDGSAYTANLIYGSSGSEFEGDGYVVYKGTSSPQTVTSLINGTTYYYTFFTKNVTNWSDGVSVNATPQAASGFKYRSAGSGNWGSPSTWQYSYDGGSLWYAAGTPPDYNNDEITILNGNTVTVASNVTVDQVTVETGGKITVNNVTLTVADGTGDDLTVDGTLELTGSSGVITTTGTLVFNSGGTYDHNRNGGTVPVATWKEGSDCNITGIVDTAPTIPSSTQPFWNFKWDGSNQTSNLSLEGQLTDIDGDFNIFSPNIVVKLFLSTSSVSDLNVGGDFIQEGGNFNIAGPEGTTMTMTVGGDLLLNGTLYINPGRGAGTVNVGGDFYTQGSLYFTFNTTEPVMQDATLNVDGDFTVSISTVNMSGSNGDGILNVKGDLNVINGGSLNEGTLYTGVGVITFNGTGLQTFTMSATSFVVNEINFTVADGATLQMATPTTALTGDGTFTLSSGGTLVISSATGITASGATGNIQVTGTRTYDAGANYIYKGTTAQVTGDGLTAADTLRIENSTGVTLSQAVTVGELAIGTATDNSIFNDGGYQVTSAGLLRLTSGTFNIGSATAATTFPAFTTYEYGTGATIAYVASADQDVTSGTYPNLSMSNSTKTIQPGSEVTVNNTLTTGGLLTIGSLGVSSSGSLILGASGTSVGNVTYDRIMPSGGVWHYISSPVVLTSSPGGSFYGWDEPTGMWDASTTATPSSGIGYTLQTTGNTVSFTGTLVSSDVEVNATSPYTTDVGVGDEQDYTDRWLFYPSRGTYGGGGFNLLGNPYTSSMSASAFITANESVFDPNYQAVYLYDGSVYYYIGSPVEGWDENNPGEITQSIQAGQGFFVLAQKDNTTFTFARSMQEHSTGATLLKSARVGDRWPGLRLKVQGRDAVSSTLVVYNEEMTAGIDPGYDVGLMSSGSDLEIYTRMPGGKSVDYVRQALPLGNYDDNIIPVGIHSDSGGLITFSADVEPIRSLKFYLEDRETGVFTNLNNRDYTVNIPANTNGTGRFYLYVTANIRRVIRSHGDDHNAMNMRIWSSHNQVYIEGEVSDRAICQVFDTRGIKIFETQLTDSYYNTFTLPAARRGVYLIKVIDGDKIFTKKIVLV